MKRMLWVTLAGLVLLAGCGADDPPSVPGGVDLTPVWRGGV